ncbi:MAG: integrase [Gallionella sp.]|nr:integrase [Gallionella sp.]
MAELILFRPKAERDAASNLQGFIDSCRNDLTIFGADLPFDESTWDVTDWVELKGHGSKRHRLVFSNLATVNDKNPMPMMEPFLSFAKGFFRYMQGYRPTKITGFRLAALRALEAALSEMTGESNPVSTDASVLNRAAQLIAERYSEAAAYRIGGQLEMLAAFMSEHKLTMVPVNWHSQIKRPSDAVRVGKEFDERRKEKMPSQAALDALPQVYRMATEPVDVIVSSVAAILCASPDRISEVLTLPVDCEVRQKNTKTGEEAYGLRWWPAKGADPMIKWVVPSMASVVQEAIGKIRKVTDEARRIAKWYEDHPGKIYLSGDFEYLRGQELLSMQELEDILSISSKGSANAWCKTNRIVVVKKESRIFARFADVENAVVRMLPKGFPLLNKEAGCKYSEALFVVRLHELGAQRGTYNCMIEPISINQINNGLGGRAAHGFSSVFSRFGFVDPDGEPIKVSTHQFRHYLNTLAQSGGLSQLDIAKWSGRKDIRQNAVYDHVTPGQMVQKIRDAIGEDSTVFGPLAELAKKTLIPRDEFARLVVPTAHTTELGYCVHDYTMSPCLQDRDCIHCSDLICVKGDEAKERQLRLQLEEARGLLQRAEEATKDGYYGSDRWLVHHSSIVERLSQLCSIMDDPKVPIGSVIQLSPPKAAAQQVSMQRKLVGGESA